MLSLANAPRYDQNTYVEDEVEFDGQAYSFLIRLVGAAEVGNGLFKEEEGKDVNCLFASRVIAFKDEADSRINLSYEVASHFPQPLIKALVKKAVDANGLGAEPAKN